MAIGYIAALHLSYARSPRDFPPGARGSEFSFAHQRLSAESVIIAPRSKGGSSNGIAIL
jgi:hypothetical protein